MWFIFFPAALIKGITCSCRPRVPLGGCGSSPAAAAAAPAAGSHRRQTPWCPHSGPHPWKTTPGHSFGVFSWLCCDAGLRFECSWDSLGGSTALDGVGGGISCTPRTLVSVWGGCPHGSWSALAVFFAIIWGFDSLKVLFQAPEELWEALGWWWVGSTLWAGALFALPSHELMGPRGGTPGLVLNPSAF